MIPHGSRQLDSRARRRWQRELLCWYARNRRDLPWRRDRDPYRVWLSEIMLQQTRVSAVLEYYRRFLQRFPTVHKLAAARESSVLAAWSGLGYYRRARMLHAAAKTIVKKHKGRFPSGVAELRALPGIGRYTAAAIASIVFNEPVAVVDGNVERVLRRAFGTDLTGKDLWQAAQELLCRRRPGDFNQAMMELGATVCLPRQPGCSICPVFDLCATRGNLEQSKSLVRQNRREICYSLATRDGWILLVQRPKHVSLMPGMWELPEIPAVPQTQAIDGPYRGQDRGQVRGQGPHQDQNQAILTLRHSITVTDYLVRVVHSPAQTRMEGRWVAKERIAQLPLTGLARKILRQAQII